MSTTRTDATTVDLATQVDIMALITGATKDTAPRVDIPDAIIKFLDADALTFAARTNRFRRTLTVNSDALAKGLLAGRRDDLKLTGSELHIAAAKHFCRMLRQYAEDKHLSTAPQRTDNVVVYRLAKQQPAKTAAPVTVTQAATAPTATAPTATAPTATAPTATAPAEAAPAAAAAK